MDHVITALVRGMERAILESVARRWSAVGLALGWCWERDGSGDEALRIDAWIEGEETPILVVPRPEPGWYEALHGCGETLAAGTARDVLDAMIYWVERAAPRELPLR